MKTEEQLKELRDIKIESYTYDLVDEMIAKFPLAEREMSKLLIYDEGQICEKHFTDTRNVLQEGQLLIFNNTKVIHARLFFKKSTGAVMKCFVLSLVLQLIIRRVFRVSGNVSGYVWLVI